MLFTLLLLSSPSCIPVTGSKEISVEKVKRHLSCVPENYHFLSELYFDGLIHQLVKQILSTYHILDTALSVEVTMKSKDKTWDTEGKPFGMGMGTRQLRNKVSRE